MFPEVIGQKRKKDSIIASFDISNRCVKFKVTSMYHVYAWGFITIKDMQM